MPYRIIPRRYRSEDGKAYTGYDIAGTSEDGTPLRVEDVTEDRRFAKLLCAVLNREQVEPVHVYDVISDILADPELKNSLLHG